MGGMMNIIPPIRLALGAADGACESLADERLTVL